MRRDSDDIFQDGMFSTMITAPLIAGGNILHAVLANQNALDPKIALTTMAVGALAVNAYTFRDDLSDG